VKRIGDRRVAAGASGQYLDPDLYDKRYGRRASDVRFYLALARERRSMLELGVGTGRIAIAAARAGVRVTGVELSSSMIERARARLAGEAREVQRRVALFEGDLRTARIGRRFPLVIAPFNVFMHLYSRADVEQALATVRAHLTQNGRFALDVVNPPLAELGEPGSSHLGGNVRVDGRTYRERERYQYDGVRQIEIVETRFERRGEKAFSTLLSHRHFFPAELEALLHYNGFAIEARFGDYHRRPFTTGSPSQVIVAKRARLRPI
jgi:SAM-dependent methyltransferase